VTAHDPFNVSRAGQIVTRRSDTVSRIAVARALLSSVLVQSDPIAALSIVSILRRAVQKIDHVFYSALFLSSRVLELADGDVVSAQILTSRWQIVILAAHFHSSVGIVQWNARSVVRRPTARQIFFVIIRTRLLGRGRISTREDQAVKSYYHYDKAIM